MNWHWWKKKKNNFVLVRHLLHDSTISGNETTKLSFAYRAYTIINATEAHNRSSATRARAPWQEKNSRLATFISSHTSSISWKYIFASINKYGIAARQLNTKSPSTTWENSSMTIVWTESESDAKHEARKKKGSYNTIFPGTTLSHPRRSSSQEDERRGRAATKIPRTSNLYTYLTLRLFTLPSLFVSARFPRRWGYRVSRALSPREHAKLRACINSTYRGAWNSPDSHSRTAVRAPPNKVEQPVGFSRESRELENRVAMASEGDHKVTIAFPRDRTDSARSSTRVGVTRARISIHNMYIYTYKHSEINEMHTKTHRALGGTGHARRTLHRDQRHGRGCARTTVVSSSWCHDPRRTPRSTLFSRAHVRSRRHELGKAVIFRAPSTVSRSRRPCLIQSTAVLRMLAPSPSLPPPLPPRRSCRFDARDRYMRLFFAFVYDLRLRDVATPLFVYYAHRVDLPFCVHFSSPVQKFIIRSVAMYHVLNDCR